MKKILLILLIAVSFSANAQRKLFGLELNANPDLATDRIAIGQVGSLSENMTLQQLLNLITSNLDVYSTQNVDDLFENYISKTNSEEYIPTSDYNIATKKYVDDGGQVVGWTSLTPGTDVTISQGKVSQVGNMITITCEYMSGANSFAEKVILTLPSTIGVSTVDIDFGASNASSQNNEGQQLYIDSGTRNIKLREGGDDLGVYSFCVTYPAI